MDRRAPSDFTWAGIVLGIALGGFFDGILLHQVLQWHHLLSAFEDRDIRFQGAGGGYVPVLMYLVAAVGLWLLWRSHAKVEAGGRLLFGNILLGVGVWNVIDVVGFHWVLGIHHIRVDTPQPILW